MARPMIAILILAAGTAPAQEPDAPRLVDLLSSGCPAERAEAALSLGDLGADALPALRAASRDADDDRTRQAARRLIGRIVAARLAEPTMVTLDVEGRPLADVVATLSARAGVPILLGPAGGPDLPGRPITLATPGPVPFWEAVRLLGQETGVRHHPGDRADLDNERPTIRLEAGAPPPWTVVRGRSGSIYRGSRTRASPSCPGTPRPEIPRRGP